jgi:hypothetical protein
MTVPLASVVGIVSVNAPEFFTVLSKAGEIGLAESSVTE